MIEDNKLKKQTEIVMKQIEQLQNLIRVTEIPINLRVELIGKHKNISKLIKELKIINLLDYSNSSI